jgi:hypothetical protein
MGRWTICRASQARYGQCRWWIICSFWCLLDQLDSRWKECILCLNNAGPKGMDAVKFVERVLLFGYVSKDVKLLPGSDHSRRYGKILGGQHVRWQMATDELVLDTLEQCEKLCSWVGRYGTALLSNQHVHWQVHTEYVCSCLHGEAVQGIYGICNATMQVNSRF